MPKVLLQTFFKTVLLILSFYWLALPIAAYGQKSDTPRYDSILENYGTSFFLSIDSADVLFKEMTSHYERSGDSCQYAQCLLQQAVNSMVYGQMLESLSLLQQAQNTLANNACADQLKAKVSLAYGQFYALRGDFQLSDSIILNAIDSYDTNWTNKATLIKLHTWVYRQDDEVSKTLPFLKKAISLAQKHKHPHLEQRALDDLAISFAIMGKLDTARFYFKRSLKVAKAQKDYLQLGIIYNSLAGLTSDNYLISNYLDSALYFAELNGNLDNQLSFTQNKALFNYNQGKYEKAYHLLWESFELKDSLYNKERYKTITELEKKYETQKQANEIQALKLENLNAELATIASKKRLNRLLYGTLILLALAGVSTYGFITIRKHRDTLAQKNKEISKAWKRSDELLLNILPADIAAELKEKGQADARDFEMVSILFTDFKGFTEQSAKLSAAELVKEINHCFKAFDGIMEKYSIEKIKTIGDAYMAAGGLPVTTDDSVKNTVLAALEMQAFIANRKAAHDAKGEPAFEMRVGIHTGPVVAGIVGVKKFQYDIWGDTVNTASRMESAGEVGKVNISQATYEILKSEPQFTFESRGKIEAKGKGTLNMYFVSKA